MRNIVIQAARLTVMIVLLLYLTFSPAVWATRVQATDAETTPVNVERLEEQISMSDGVRLAASLFKPYGNTPHGGWPAVIMIHGWGGDRSTYEEFAPGFAKNGYVVLTYDCRGFGQRSCNS
ncbi:alpha/beta fold hydrolase [Effusibacillus lacus]|uniref:Xaa-Pro dipeptidyl-peptidase-like domain-containing protein n=1 Tax=Effusibacillus lacus TaxID=1348429 RepID=A0A292YM90_9BACL|nr:alpha/beta fold hydrolase [Effusibacillus lacus]GAX90296.1 hypothetical protein EFBL_1922 [Effusibacillus lacus]